MTMILGLLFVWLFQNKWEVQITLRGENVAHVEYMDSYKDPGADAIYTGTLFPFIHQKVDVQRDKKKVDTSKLGTYTVTYRAHYKKYDAKANRKVIVEDKTAPKIELVSDSNHYTLPNHTYEEEGYTAIDNYDGDITANVIRTETPETITYTVTDSNGNKTSIERKIIYDDRKGPEITLNGGKDTIVYLGDNYTDSYQAIDDLDGDITSKMTVEGTVNTSINGDYTLHYHVTDSYGNHSNATRVVHVVNRPINQNTNNMNPKTIFLTFDDGPGKATDSLLAILRKYNVKATFFTTSAYPGYADAIRKEAADGHTVALHTYSHNYAKIYASSDAYWNDFNAQNEVIHQMTGSYTKLFRFPGGSSNTISRNYSPGIMTQLTQQANAKGLTYFDWNVSSGDAGETTSTDQVFSNMTSQIAANARAGKASITLQHDYKQFSVNAVERIIQWGLENGYNFQPLTDGVYTVHHSINN